MSETPETGINLLPVLFLAVYWAYLLVWHERRKHDDPSALFNSGLPPPGSDPVIQNSDILEMGIAEYDFDETIFMEGARNAYEFILSHFAAGDMNDLKGLLDAEVFRVFEQEVASKKENASDLRFVSLKNAKIVEKNFGVAATTISVQFESEIFLPSHDELTGDQDQSSTLQQTDDLWTFRREHSSRSPVWMLVATEMA